MSEAETKSPFNPSINRRTLAAGAAAGIAWSVPAVVSASAAPYCAASSGDGKTAVSASVCYLFYRGSSNNYQGHSINFDVKYPGDTIPKGSMYSWKITVRGGYAGTGGSNTLPALNYDAKGNWELLTKDVQQFSDGVSFTLVLSFTGNYPTSSIKCMPAIAWTNANDGAGGVYTVRNGAHVSIASLTGSVPSGALLGSGCSEGKEYFEGGSLEYIVAKRWPNSINKSGREPHKYLSRGGAQTEYPLIKWNGNINQGNVGYNTQTLYPGSNVPVEPTEMDGSQAITPARP